MLTFLHQILQNASMEKSIFTRDLHIPKKSFFLFGPRGVGKSHFLNMRSLAESGKVKMKKMIGVYLGKEEYFFEGVEVININKFLNSLHAGLIY